MIRMVIVEDKPLILRSIREKIQNFGPQVAIVGEALNGREALSVIEAQRPDIVLTDIRMPVMDGLQLIAETKRLLPDTEFIIISGHDEFAYARQAIKLNVREYLLKPVDDEELRLILGRLIDTISARKHERERDFLHDAIHSYRQSVSGHPLSGFDRFVVVSLQAGSYSNFIIDYSNPFNGFWSGADCEPQIEALLQEDEKCWFLEGKTLNEQLVVIGGRRLDDARVGLLADDLERFLKNYDIPITAGVSRCILGVEQLAIETQFLRAFIRNFSIFGKSSVIRQKEWGYLNEDRQDVQMLLDASLENKLTLLVRGEKKEALLQEIRSLFERWEENGVTQIRLESLLKQLIQICHKAVNGMLPVHPNVYMEVDEIISISKNYETLFQGLAYILDYFFPKSDRPKGNRTILEEVEKVKRFLNENYQRPITIHDIARMINFHPGYVSRIFKNAVGVSPMEYLTTYRINKAKEWMETNPEMTLKEIAELVGYSNPFYFSRIFKVVAGVSPSEYRNAKPAPQRKN